MWSSGKVGRTSHSRGLDTRLLDRRVRQPSADDATVPARRDGASTLGGAGESGTTLVRSRHTVSPSMGKRGLTSGARRGTDVVSRSLPWGHAAYPSDSAP